MCFCWVISSDAEDSESEIRVGFVTYSNVLHFYNLKVCFLYYFLSEQSILDYVQYLYIEYNNIIYGYLL